MHCKINGCSSDPRSKGLCAYHYERERRAKLGVRCGRKDCERQVFAGGLCQRHWRQERGDTKTENGKAASITCGYADCEREVFARAYCHKHYMRQWRHGEVVPDGYRKKSRNCLYCTMRVFDGTKLCGEHKEWASACVVCGFDRVVEAAHVLPRASGAPREDWNMIALCPNHHRLYDGQLLTKAEARKLSKYVEVATQMMEEVK